MASLAKGGWPVTVSGSPSALFLQRAPLSLSLLTRIRTIPSQTSVPLTSPRASSVQWWGRGSQCTRVKLWASLLHRRHPPASPLLSLPPPPSCTPDRPHCRDCHFPLHKGSTRIRETLALYRFPFRGIKAERLRTDAPNGNNGNCPKEKHCSCRGPLS